MAQLVGFVRRWRKCSRYVGYYNSSVQFGLMTILNPLMNVYIKVRMSCIEKRLRITLQLILALYFKMLSVALSGTVLIRNFFEETYSCHLMPTWKLTRYILNFLHFKSIFAQTKKWKQYQFVIQEMMDQICRLEIVDPPEIPEVCYWGWREKKGSFLAIA